MVILMILSNELHSCSLCSQHEGQDGGAEARVVSELLQVAAVLPLGPDHHLNEAHQGEERHGQALRHQREAHPGAHLQRQCTARSNTATCPPYKMAWSNQARPLSGHDFQVDFMTLLTASGCGLYSIGI